MAAEGALARWGEAFRAGADLYNAGAFFEAHEAWEALWSAEREPGPRFVLQGLIQIAAGYHKLFAQRRPEPAARLLSRGLEKLLQQDPTAFGLEAFCAGVRGSVAALSAAGTSAGPSLDREDVPTL